MPQRLISRLLIAGSAVAALAVPGQALAVSAQGQQMLHSWAGADRCVQNAQRQFPDFTAEAQAKRDVAVQQCLSGANLPPRQPMGDQTAPHQ